MDNTKIDSLLIPNEQPRLRESFDFNWQFFKGDLTNADEVQFIDSSWSSLKLPHDWSIEGPFDESNPSGGDGGYLPTGIGWYRKHFQIPEKYSGKKISIEFDGIYMNSDVWVNGIHLGNHPNGYTSFYYDLTPYLNYEGIENVIAVRVNNTEQPNSRWYTGSGIYRHTWLSFTEKLHIDHWGTFVSTPLVCDDFTEIKAVTSVCNETNEAVEFTIHSVIIDQDDETRAEISSHYLLPAGQNNEFEQNIRVEDPRLWMLDDPSMYILKTEIIKNNKIVDIYETPFGIRKIEFDGKQGFLLNNNRIKINGVCIHHDGGCVGAAVPERIMERRLEILKSMGCNAIRTSHNPPSPEMLDMCDRMGFLVMDEAFDEWRISKCKNGESEFGYHKYFDECSIKDLTSMLKRDRNHPGVILWSVGNEIPEQTHAEGAGIVKKLVDICHSMDYSRPVTSACDNIKAEPSETTDAFLEQLDIVGYNYVDRWRTRTETFYGDDHFLKPERKMLGSENVSCSGIRGEYKLEGNPSQWWRGPYYTAMINAERLWKFTKTHDYVAGDFMWTGIDYIGEARWPNKNASSGVLDTCGFIKDGFYFYQSQWTDKPVLHIFPHWNWEGFEGKVIPVICYTNCESVELFLNGKSFGVKSFEFPRQGMTNIYPHFEKPLIHVTTSDLHIAWDVPYEPGTIKVIGKRDGKIVSEKEIRTSGEPYKIEMMTDRSTIKSGELDVCNITIRVLDQEGNICPTADNLIYFKVEGEGTLLGVDNGKPDSHESFKTDHRHAFNGLCLAVIESKLSSGNIQIEASSKGLVSNSLIITSVR